MSYKDDDFSEFERLRDAGASASDIAKVALQ